MPEAALRSLDLAVRRRVDRMLSGEFRSSHLGVATELAQVRPYQPGDDVRQMDWLATARTNEPHVRVHVAERALTTWLLLDRSISMQFGTADRRKADVAEGVALALGQVASRRGNRLGVITTGSGAPSSRRPRQGRAGLLAALLALRLDEEPTSAAAHAACARDSSTLRASRGSARCSSSSAICAARATGRSRWLGSPRATTSS